MQKLILFSLFVIILFSCNKETVEPPKNHKDIKVFADTIQPTFILAGKQSGQGIVYWDINPDLEFVFSPYETKDTIWLDLDSNNTYDYYLNHYHSSIFQQGVKIKYYKIAPLRNNEISVLDTLNLVDSISFNGIIDNKRNWTNSVGTLYSNSYINNGNPSSGGFFTDYNKSYIGLRFNTNKGIQYGWLYIDNLKIGAYGYSQPYIIIK